ncbi:MAG: DHH family phosphoesterase [Pseudobdellovibrionaceae bacterium]
MIKEVADQINNARSLILSTHRQCDGDGLGAQLGLYHTLKAAGKDVRIINVDATPKKYRFLHPDDHIQYFEEKADFTGADLALIFDTNDERLVEPLFSELRKRVSRVAFVDHHPLLKKGPQPSVGSWIDVTAASTGELAYRLIKELQYPMNKEAARALYTSITFDTQLYRFIRNSPNSHLIAAELLQFDIGIEEIHRHLFGHQTVQKMAFLAKALAEIEYFCEGQLAVLRLSDHDLLSFGLEPDESRDVIDMLMTIDTLEAAALFREDSPDSYKVSFRSKGKIEVLSAAENLGGGGHLYAAGAFVQSPYPTLKANVIKELSAKLNNRETK